MVDTCHWSSLPLAAQLSCSFHTPHSHFCAHIFWKAFSYAHTPFGNSNWSPQALLETYGFPD